MTSMCPFKISSTIPRGFDGIRSIGISLALLTTLACNTQGHAEPDIGRITEVGRARAMLGSAETARPRIFFSNEDILMGHSGDPWSSHDESKDFRSSFIDSESSNERARNGSNTSNRERTSKKIRPRRSVVHLYNMVVCATGCNPMSYKGYGCYCGFLGSGSAVDGIDQCCRMHDRCYDATECPTFLEYFVPYYWKCYRGYRPVCAVEHGKWGGSGSCAQRLCECDRALSECLRRFPCPTSKAVCTTSPWRLIQNVFMIF